MAFPTNDPSNYIGAAPQSAKDVEGTTFYFFKHKDGSGFDVDPDVQSEKEGGDGQETGLRYFQKITNDGGFTGNARPGHAGRLWAWALGQDSVASLAAGLQEHTAAPAASLPYLTVDQRAPQDLIERVTNVVVTGLTEEWEAGKPLTIAGQFISGGSAYKRDVASALTAVRETLPPFQYPGASVSLTVNDGLGGAAATTIKITKGKIEVKRGVDDAIQTTGLNREDVVPLAFDVDFDGTARYESVELYRNVFYGGGSQIRTDIATGTFNLFSARGSFSHRVNLPLLDVVGAKLNRLDPDGKTVYVDISGMSRKNATHGVFAVTRTPDASSYLTP